MSEAFSISPVDYEKCVGTYADEGRLTSPNAAPLEFYRFGRNGKTSENFQLLNLFLAEQEESLLRTDFSNCVVVAIEVNILYHLSMNIWTIKTSLGIKSTKVFPNFQDKPLSMKNWLDDYKANKFGSINLFYGIRGIEDELEQDLISAVKSSSLTKKKKALAFRGQLEIIHAFF
jgi:hypothetical protein